MGNKLLNETKFSSDIGVDFEGIDFWSIIDLSILTHQVEKT